MQNQPERIEQTAVLGQVDGKAHIIRDGYFYLAEKGMALQPGDRITTEAGSRVEVDFSGTDQNLIVGKGSAASLFVSSDTSDGQPQWIVADLFGQDVFFAKEGEEAASAEADPQSLYGLFGAADDSGADWYPIAGTIGAVALAAVAYDGSNDDTSTGSATSATQANNSTADTTAGATGSEATTNTGTNTDGGTTPGGSTDSTTTDSTGPLDGTPLADTPLADLPIGNASMLTMLTGGTPLADLPLGSQTTDSGAPSLDTVLAPLQSLAPEQLTDTLGTVANTIGIGTNASLPINEGLPISDPTGSLPV